MLLVMVLALVTTESQCTDTLWKKNQDYKVTGIGQLLIADKKSYIPAKAFINETNIQVSHFRGYLFVFFS